MTLPSPSVVTVGYQRPCAMFCESVKRPVAGSNAAFRRSPQERVVVEVPAVDENSAVGQRRPCRCRTCPTRAEWRSRRLRLRIPDRRSEVCFGRNVAGSRDDQHFPVVHQRHVNRIDSHKIGQTVRFQDCVPATLGHLRRRDLQPRTCQRAGDEGHTADTEPFRRSHHLLRAFVSLCVSVEEPRRTSVAEEGMKPVEWSVEQAAKRTPLGATF